MANAKTRLQMKAAKERRKKFIAIGGAVLLAVVLVIQVPRTMKMFNGSSDETTPTAVTTPVPSDSPAAQPASVSPTATAPGKLPDRNAEPAPEEGQLMSFELFESKDPFVQQVMDAAAEDAAAATGQGSQPASAAPTSASQPATTSTQTTGQRNLSAVIDVNGSQETVKLRHTFPADSPTFTLVSAGKSAAKIGIAGGRLAGGDRTVTLKLGRKVTLVNTADGTRYVLALRSVQ